MVSESKANLRDAQDEIYQLKNQLTKSKLDLKSRDDDLQRLEAKHEALENHNLELSSHNQKFLMDPNSFFSPIRTHLPLQTDV